MRFARWTFAITISAIAIAEIAICAITVEQAALWSV
jgi:hypothetical protein